MMAHCRGKEFEVKRLPSSGNKFSAVIYGLNEALLGEDAYMAMKQSLFPECSIVVPDEAYSSYVPLYHKG